MTEPDEWDGSINEPERTDHLNTRPDGWSTQDVDDALDAAFTNEHYEATSDDELTAELTDYTEQEEG